MAQSFFITTNKQQMEQFSISFKIYFHLDETDDKLDFTSYKSGTQFIRKGGGTEVPVGSANPHTTS